MTGFPLRPIGAYESGKPMFDRRLGPVLAFALVSGLLLVSVRAITSSLWSDETLTYWFVKDGLGETLSRAGQWSNQSPLYYLCAWLSLHFSPPFIGLEPALRLPSVIAIVVATIFVLRLGRLLAGTKVGVLSAIAFLCIPEVAFATCDARPYALALALLAASMFYFLKWLDTGRAWHAILYVITSALVVYAHYLFALALAAQVIYGFRRNHTIVLLWFVIGLLCLPLAGPFLHLYGTRREHSFNFTFRAFEILWAFVPFVLATAVVFFVALWPIRRAKAKEPEYKIPYAFLGVWLFLPPLFLFLISVSTDINIFIPRYYLSDAPAIALLAGYVLARTSLPGVAVVGLVCVLQYFTWQKVPTHGSEDWRGAIQTVNRIALPDDLVLLPSSFIEGTTQSIDRYPQDMLYAPQMAYPVTQARAVRLPANFDEKMASMALIKAKHIFLVGLATEERIRYALWLGDRLPGYSVTQIDGFGGVAMMMVSKAEDADEWLSSPPR